MPKPVSAGDLCSLELMRGAWILVHIIARDESEEGPIVHFASFDLTAHERPTDASLSKVQNFSLKVPHAAVREAAFLETRPVRLGTRPVDPESLRRYAVWSAAWREGKVSPSPGPVAILI